VREADPSNIRLWRFKERLDESRRIGIVIPRKDPDLMQPLSRRGIALLATAATLGAGSLATATQALGAPSGSSGSASVSSNRSIVDLTVQLVLGLLGANPTVSQVQSQLVSNPLSAVQLGNLLENAGPGQLDALLGGGLSTVQLSGAVSSLASTNELAGLLGTLTPTQTGDLLAPLTGTTLSTALGVLSPAQITSALTTLSPAELSSVVDGLTSAQTGALLSGLSSGNLTQLTATIAALTGVQLSDGLGVLSFVQLGDVLAPLSGTPLSSVLGVLTSGPLNSALGTLTPSELTTLFGGMTTPEVGGILSGANPAQLVSLLGALNPTQLGGALGLLNAAQLTSVVTTLNPTELSGLLAVLNPTQLTSVVGLLNPAQITGVLGSPGASASLVTGLAGTATNLGTTASLGSVDALVGQLQALLGGGLPAVPGIDGLIATVQQLLGVPGLDPAMLTGLLTTAASALRTAGAGIDTSSLLGLIGTLYSVLGLPGAGTSAHPGSGTTPAPGAKPSAGQVGFTAYRATVGAIKVASNRRSAKVTVSCPASAPKGCLVALNGVVAGRKAFASKTIVVLRNATRTFTVALSRATTARLNAKGGSLSVSALTAFSSRSAVTRSVKLARRH
jgi:hypothetical protein